LEPLISWDFSLNFLEQLVNFLELDIFLELHYSTLLHSATLIIFHTKCSSLVPLLYSIQHLDFFFHFSPSPFHLHSSLLYLIFFFFFFFFPNSPPPIYYLSLSLVYLLNPPFLIPPSFLPLHLTPLVPYLEFFMWFLPYSLTTAGSYINFDPSHTSENPSLSLLPHHHCGFIHLQNILTSYNPLLSPPSQTSSSLVQFSLP
jgi:hypothetical protein